MLRITILFLIVTSIVSCKHPATTQPTAKQNDELTATPTTIFLVRHSEKESGSDPVLSDAGLKRNLQLENLLSQVQFDAVFSSAFRRTEMTAKTICDAQNLEFINYDHKNLPGLSEKILTEYEGQQILVVGHSNTTPTLCGILDGTNAHEAFDESDYGNVMVVVVPRMGPAKTLRLRF